MVRKKLTRHWVCSSSLYLILLSSMDVAFLPTFCKLFCLFKSFLCCIFSVAERNDPLFVCSFLQHFCLSEVRTNIHLFIVYW